MARTQYSIRTIKQFDYRGDPAKQWSNRYFFDGGAIGDTAAMVTFMDAWVLAEKACIPPDVSIVQAHVYAPTSEVAIASKAYTSPGTLAVSGSLETPGDCCAVLRMATTKVSTKNHTVYVFSYFHRALQISSGSQPDQLWGPQKTAVELWGTDLLNGITIAGRTYKRTTPDGHLTTGRAVDQWIGHRDFPR